MRSFLPRSKFQVDLLWNYAGFAILALSGIALNVLVARLYGSATLGAFNQVMAAYIVGAMLASGGINYSVLRALAAHAEDEVESARVVSGALVPTLILSAAGTAAFWAAAGPIEEFSGSDAVRHGLEAVTPGLFFFAMNKVLIAVVNGLGHMRMFAAIQALRGTLLVGALLVASILEVPGPRLPIIFTAAETLLFLLLIAYTSSHVAWWRASPGDWSREHLRFGVKCIGSGMLVELNSRIDVLLLGHFRSDSDVGVYSYAAFFAEGFFQLIVVLQNNYHPLLAKRLALRALEVLGPEIRKGRRTTYAFVAPAAVLAVLLFPFFARLVGDRPEFGQSQVVFAILATGIAAASGYLLFQNTLSMANLPGWQTVFMILVVAVNVAGNVLLIPTYGIVGAATATGLTFVASAVILVAMVRRLVGLRL